MTGLWFVISTAGAADGLDAAGLHTATLDSDLRDPLYVERPGALSGDEAFLGVLLQGALHDGQHVDHLAGLTLAAGATLHERLRIDVQAPLALALDDGVGVFGAVPGDLRMRAAFNLVAPEPVVGGGGGPGLGLVTWVDLPTGDERLQMGNGRPAPGAKLAGTWEGRWFTASVDGGVALPPLVENLDEGGLTVLTGASVGVLVDDRVGVHLESTVRLPEQGPAGMQLALSGRVASGFAAVTVGLPAATGLPTARLLVGGTFARRSADVNDMDSVGTLTIADACPGERETLNGYKDDDGCPDALGSLSVDTRWNGRSIPAEVVLRTGEKEQTVRVGAAGHLVDAVPGSVWSGEATAPCLRGQASTVASEEGAVLSIDLRPDRPRRVRVEVVDADGRPVAAEVFFATDTSAACVPSGALPIVSGGDEVELGPGTHTVTATTGALGSGTAVLPPDATSIQVALEPDTVRLRDGRLVTAEPVRFTGERIEAASFPLLDELAAWLLTHDGRVVIGSHTDNSASEPLQLRISRGRAQAVRQYLVGKGVSAARLVAIGYGPTRPVDTNRTAAGRARNDRITLVIEERP